MRLLSELLLPDQGARASYVVEIWDEGSEQSVVIESAEPLAGYNLEATAWGDGERHPDAVVMGEVEGIVWVCFIELKTSMRPKESKQDPAQLALGQLEGGIVHFHPTARGTSAANHGAFHHDQWEHQVDMLEVTPPKHHRVLGIAVGFRHVPRPPPTNVVPVGAARVRLAVVHLSGAERNRATTTFSNLLRLAGAIR
jgi:hypothetical protein